MMWYKTLTETCRRLQVRARREVVLSAGSIGSAQLMMVSGIGPADHLRDVGIEPLVDLPVGHNLQDHVTFSGNAFIVNDSRICVNDVSGHRNNLSCIIESAVSSTYTYEL